jgi:5-enolpyruvylshikimate-3-phosphate synthase
VKFARVLETVGARVADGRRTGSSPPDDPCAGFDLDMTSFPDAAMTAAVLALFTEGLARCATSRAGA